MKYDKKVGVFIVVLAVIVGIGVFLYSSYSGKEVYKPVQIEGKSKKELQQELKRIEHKIKVVANQQESLQQKLKDAEKNKGKVTALSKNVEQCKDKIMDVQKEALYVGKFICKVNTCQTNPKDENYPVFLSITKELENAKQALFDAQDAFDNAKSSVSNILEYQTEMKQNEELTMLLTTDKEHLEKALID